jgi:hypothetical protein
MKVERRGGSRGRSPHQWNSSGHCLRGLLLGAALHAGGVIAGVFLVRVLRAAQAEQAAGVLPCLAVAIPVETKLGQLLANLGGGLFFERHPNPLAYDFGEPIRGGQLLVQRGQNFWCRQRAIGFSCFGINRQASIGTRSGECGVRSGNCGFRCCCLRLLGLMMGSVVEL